MQNHYNLVYREEEREMIPLCVDEGVGVPWSPLARGLLAGAGRATARRPHSGLEATPWPRCTRSDFDVVDVVREVATRADCRRADRALLAGKPAVTAPIVGATKLSHLQDAIAATEVSLTEEESSRLERPTGRIPSSVTPTDAALEV